LKQFHLHFSISQKNKAKIVDGCSTSIGTNLPNSKNNFYEFCRILRMLYKIMQLNLMKNAAWFSISFVVAKMEHRLQLHVSPGWMQYSLAKKLIGFNFV